MRFAIVAILLLSGCLQGGPSTPAPGLSDDERCAREREANAKLREDVIAEATETAARVAGKIVADNQPKPVERVERKPEVQRPVQQGYTGAKVFTTPGCLPCAELVSRLRAVERRSRWTVGLGKDNHWWLVVDPYAGMSPEVTEAYPTVIYYRNGVEYSRHVGFDVRRAGAVFDQLMREHPAYPGEGR